jgi:hypothetical protein
MRTDGKTIEQEQLLSEVWGFHGGDYGQSRLLGRDAVWLW